jgi:hypothetical protein
MRSLEQIIGDDLVKLHIKELENNIEQLYGTEDTFVCFTIQKRFGQEYEKKIIKEISYAQYTYEIDNENDSFKKLKIYIG